MKQRCKSLSNFIVLVIHALNFSQFTFVEFYTQFSVPSSWCQASALVPSRDQKMSACTIPSFEKMGAGPSKSKKKEQIVGREKPSEKVESKKRKKFNKNVEVELGWVVFQEFHRETLQLDDQRRLDYGDEYYEEKDEIDCILFIKENQLIIRSYEDPTQRKIVKVSKNKKNNIK